ncbi:MAG: type III-A CRISPR-associated RAMP protein Csm4 [Desulfococcaceae bacterium]
MRYYKLQFASAIHVDSRGSGSPEVADEFVHSDTLSAALCLSRATVFGDWSDEFFLDPPFRVGSAFPYMGDHLLFPVPAWPIWEDMDPAERKRFKKVRWLSGPVLERVLAGKILKKDEVAILPGGIAFSSEEDTAGWENRPPWVLTERQRVRVDRLGVGDSEPFFFALQFFSPECGLWFPASVPNETEFRAALDFLSDSGLGADRSSGLGHFKVSSEGELALKTPKKDHGFFLLSLFNPATEEIPALKEKAAYGLTTRSGWISGVPIGRPPVRALTEGSFLPKKPKGRVVETLKEIKSRLPNPPAHNAPRDFRAVWFPCAKPPFLREGKT